MVNYNPGLQIDFKFDGGTLQENLLTFDSKFDSKVNQISNEVAEKSELSMKMHAPWTDRTGDARKGLYSLARSVRPIYTILFGHKVNYGVWLEVANKGKYQIIMPILLDAGRSLMRSLEHVLVELDMPFSATAIVTPGIGLRRGTSQGPERVAEREARRTKRFMRRAGYRVAGTTRRTRTHV